MTADVSVAGGADVAAPVETTEGVDDEELVELEVEVEVGDVVVACTTEVEVLDAPVDDGSELPSLPEQAPRTIAPTTRTVPQRRDLASPVRARPAVAVTRRRSQL